MDTSYMDPFIETLGREALTQIQLKKLQMMLGPVLETNSFYKRKLTDAGLADGREIRSLAELRHLPRLAHKVTRPSKWMANWLSASPQLRTGMVHFRDARSSAR